MKIYLLFYMCHFAMGLTHCYKTTVFWRYHCWRCRSCYSACLWRHCQSSATSLRCQWRHHVLCKGIPHTGYTVDTPWKPGNSRRRTDTVTAKPDSDRGDDWKDERLDVYSEQWVECGTSVSHRRLHCYWSVCLSVFLSVCLSVRPSVHCCYLRQRRR